MSLLGEEVGMDDIKDNRGRWISPGDAVWTLSVYLKTWGIYAGYNEIIMWDKEEDLIKKVPLEKSFGRLTVISDHYPVVSEINRLKAANELVGENGTAYFKDFMAWIYTQKKYLVCVPFVQWVPVFLKGAVILDDFLRLRPVLMNPKPEQRNVQHGQFTGSTSSSEDHDDGVGGGSGYDSDDDDDDDDDDGDDDDVSFDIDDGDDSDDDEEDVAYDGSGHQPDQQGGLSQTTCSHEEKKQYNNHEAESPEGRKKENNEKTWKFQLVQERARRLRKTNTAKNKISNSDVKYKPLYMDRLQQLHQVPWSAWFKQS